MRAFRHAQRITRRYGALGVLAALGVAGLAACGPSSSAPGAAGAAAAKTGAPGRSPAATMPSPGATLSSTDDNGETAVISNQEGDGFTMLYDPSSLLDSSTDEYTLETYDAAGKRLPALPAGRFSGGCGAADVINSVGRLIITLHITATPAQGVVQASNKLTMTAWNAVTGASVWTDTLVESTTQQIPCPLSDHELAGDLWNFVPTLDGHWGVFVLPTTDANGDTLSDAIDLTTGKLYPNPDLEGVLGNDVVTGSGSGNVNGPATLTVTTPGAWAPLGSTTSGSGTGSNDGTGLPLQGQATTQNGPEDYAPTGYTGAFTSFDSDDSPGPGTGIGAVATPDGDFLIATYTDSSGNLSYGGYSLPSLHQVWSAQDPDAGNNDQIVGVSDTALLITRTDGDTYLLSLDPATGQQQWKIDIGPGGSVCDLTSTQVLAMANSQLATLSAATGKQLSYKPDPYQDSSGGDTCPAVVESGLGGTGFNNNQVTQLLMP